MRQLDGRCALVTGGGRGLGRAVALRLAARGAEVVVGFGRSARSARDVVASIRAQGGRAEAHHLPLERAEDVETLLGPILREHPELDAVVHCAGVAAPGRVEDLRLPEIRRSLEVNLLSTLEMTRVLLPTLRRQDRSDVVMVSSVATTSLRGGGSAYSMAKAGVEALAMTLAKEELAHGMHVNVVVPGLLNTDMGRELLATVAGSASFEEVEQASPFGRVCTPDDVARVIAFLLSDDAGYVTGTSLTVDGARPIDWRSALAGPQAAVAEVPPRIRTRAQGEA